MIAVTIDTEPDLTTGEFKSIILGIPKICEILDNHNIKASFFVTGECLEKFPKIFKSLSNQGHEIALHSYEHKRMDELSYEEKENQIRKAKRVFERILKKSPSGFRAPQLSIDDDSLDLLEKYQFKYDSSHAPLNLLQLLFFPNKVELWLKSFLSPRKIYNIRGNLCEIPTSSLGLPFVSFSMRIMPQFTQPIFTSLLKFFYKDLVYYAHSWDFIKVEESKTEKLFPHTDYIRKFDKFLAKAKKRNKFAKMEDLI